MTFLDTNVLVYAVDFRDPRKQQIAQRIIDEALFQTNEYALSVQTLSEFSNVALSKLKKTEEEVAELVKIYIDIRLIEPNGKLVLQGLKIKNAYRIQFYDALMLAAAQNAGADRIFTEDLNEGQSYDGVVSVNPFR